MLPSKSYLASLSPAAYGRFVAAYLSGPGAGVGFRATRLGKRARAQLAALRSRSPAFQAAVWRGHSAVGGCLWGRYGAVHGWLSVE